MSHTFCCCCNSKDRHDDAVMETREAPIGCSNEAFDENSTQDTGEESTVDNCKDNKDHDSTEQNRGLAQTSNTPTADIEAITLELEEHNLPSVVATHSYNPTMEYALLLEKEEVFRVIHTEDQDWFLGYRQSDLEYGLIARNRVKYKTEPCEAGTFKTRAAGPKHILSTMSMKETAEAPANSCYQLPLIEKKQVQIVRKDTNSPFLLVYDPTTCQYGFILVNKLDDCDVSEDMRCELMDNDGSESETTTSDDDDTINNYEFSPLDDIDNNRANSEGIYYTRKSNKLVAILSYTAENDNEMSIQKGQELSVVQESEYWMKVRNSESNAVGFVPKQCVAFLGTLDAFAWYHGSLSAVEATKLLKRDADRTMGSFLVRESSSRPGHYTLSLVTSEAGDITHYQIETEGSTYFIEDEKHFDSLEQLAEYHKQSTETALGCCLQSPCQKTEFKATTIKRDAWEIPRASLKLNNEIGSGSFGSVYLGFWLDETPVAVKVLNKGSMTSEEFKQEGNTMKNLDHENILKLYGICSENEPLYIVTEYIEAGSLDKYLKKNKEHLQLKHWLDMAEQIAAGMEYMEDNKFIHRDLGARNILVDIGGVMKIADFGLARMTDDADDGIYKSKKSKFPVKWTAPESLVSHKFSIKSDVWSFGVLLVEIFTNGCKPYPRWSNKKVSNNIKAGKRHPKPEHCPEEVYKIMLSCWETDASTRPSFELLHREIHDYKKRVIQKNVPVEDIMD